jgi:hypothetical protein
MPADSRPVYNGVLRAFLLLAGFIILVSMTLASPEIFCKEAAGIAQYIFGSLAFADAAVFTGNAAFLVRDLRQQRLDKIEEALRLFDENLLEPRQSFNFEPSASQQTKAKESPQVVHAINYTESEVSQKSVSSFNLKNY